MSAEAPTAGELRAAVGALRGHARRVAGLSALSGLLVLAPSWYMLEVYDRVVNSRNPLTLAMLTAGVLIAYAVLEVLEWARGEIAFAAACGFERRLGARVFDAAFEASRRRLAGGGMQALSDLRVIRDFLPSPALLALTELPASLLFLVLLFAASPLLGAVALAVAGLQLVLALLNERGTREPLVGANRAAFAAQQLAERAVANAPLVTSMGMAADLQARWQERQREAVQRQALASARGGRYQSLSKLAQNVANSALLGLSCWLLLHDALGGGGAMLVVTGILGARVLAPFVQAITQWHSVVGARDAWTRLGRLLEAAPAAPQRMPLPAPTGALQVDNAVACAPGSSVPVLKGLGFALRPGEALVVVGPSAAGKTTLARLLLGLLPAATGKVRLDGVDVHGWDKSELGPSVGYLPQGVELVEGTVAENIARFGSVDAQKVRAAAAAAGLEALIESLPQGLDTWIGPHGAVLSGGQRQRVALARALYGDPVFVVLDEPNSSLDDAGDEALARAIEAGKARGCTFVVMSHRASVLAVADKLLILRDGQQQAFGPRDEVLAAMRQGGAAQGRVAPAAGLQPAAAAAAGA